MHFVFAWMRILLARASPLINGIIIAGAPFHVKSVPPSNWIKYVNDIADVLIERVLLLMRKFSLVRN